MPYVYFFLKRNMIEVFFAYGLVFFVMGLAIALQYRAHSNFQLATSLRHLAAFGILHGLGEWGSIFIPLQSDYMPLTVIKILQAGQRALWALSFTALIAFGVELMAPEHSRRRWAIGVPAAMFLAWSLGLIGYFFRNGPSADPSSMAWLDMAEIWARYFLGLPGMALATFALVKQYRVLRPFNPPRLTVNLIFLALLFGVYTFMGGLVVPSGPFFPSSRINTATFLETTYIPVQVVRSLTGLAMAYFTIRLLKIFNLETDRQLEEAERQRSIARERQRISQDLHDGVIQRIYAAGLTLENALYGDGSTGTEGACSPAMVRDAIGQLNRAIDDVRRYALGLKPVQLEETDLRKGLENIIGDFKAHSLLPIELKVAGTPYQLPSEKVGHFYHIVLEALQNVRRHSLATSVWIDLIFRPVEVEVAIRDNGVGFRPSSRKGLSGTEGQGLRNMEQRAHEVGGALKVESEGDRGTTVRLILPAKG